MIYGWNGNKYTTKLSASNLKFWFFKIIWLLFYSVLNDFLVFEFKVDNLSNNEDANIFEL